MSNKVPLKEEGRYDPRNKLNDLTGKEWLKLTKSFWVSEKSKEDKFAFQHPAPFLVKDIEKLISLFTKKGMTVLDPFNGIGTTILAAYNQGRRGVGVELSLEYCELTEKRLTELNVPTSEYTLIHGDSLQQVPLINDMIDYCVTSPPYHNILKNKGSGLRDRKIDFRSGARKGVEYYSDDPNDLGNQDSYEAFLHLFTRVMASVYDRLRDKAYTSIIISDFTVDKKEVNVQSTIVSAMESIGYEFVGTTILLQDNKPLYPFGYPFAYKINHHHQNIINFRKVLS
jgi:DNA modification methylase